MAKQWCGILFIGLLLAGCNSGGSGGTEVQGAASSDDVCVKHMKHLGLATMMFTQDSNEKMPDFSTPETAKTALQPLLSEKMKGEPIFTCSHTGQPFQPNKSLTGVELGKIPDTMTTVMFYEPAARTDGTRALLYVDGHVKVVQESEWPAIKQASGITN